MFSNRRRLPFPSEALFDAVCGSAYAVDREGTLLAFSRKEQNVDVGRSLFGIIKGDVVRQTYRTLHEQVWTGQRPSTGFTFRCDAPEMERHMYMSLSLIEAESIPVAVLYQSIVISETPRPRIPLFAFDWLSSRRPFAADHPVVTLCSYCQKVAWPGASDGQEWIEAVDFYLRGGAREAVVSHGVCEDCMTRVLGPGG